MGHDYIIYRYMGFKFNEKNLSNEDEQILEEYLAMDNDNDDGHGCSIKVIKRIEDYFVFENSCYLVMVERYTAYQYTKLGKTYTIYPDTYVKEIDKKIYNLKNVEEYKLDKEELLNIEDYELGEKEKELINKLSFGKDIKIVAIEHAYDSY